MGKVVWVVWAALSVACSSGGSPSGGVSTGGARNAPADGTSGAMNASGASGSSGSPNGSGGAASGTGGTSGSSGSGGTSSNAGTNAGGAGESSGDGGLSGGGSDADSSTPVPTVIGTLGEPCAPNGAYGCAGEAQKGQLICANGEWAPNGNCAGDANCDSTEGANAGSCQPIVAECAGEQPGATFCRDLERFECGPDLVTAISIETCSSAGCAPEMCVLAEWLCQTTASDCLCELPPYDTVDSSSDMTSSACAPTNCCFTYSSMSPDNTICRCKYGWTENQCVNAIPGFVGTRVDDCPAE
jgi:hypothetical protein